MCAASTASAASAEGIRTVGLGGAGAAQLSSVLDQLQCANVSNFMPRRPASRENSAGSTARRGEPNQLIFDARFEGGRSLNMLNGEMKGEWEKRV